MVEEIHPMTLEGREKLGKESEELKTAKRGEITEQVEIARGFRDLSESFEYESARDEQASVEGRIAAIENMIRLVQVIDNDGVDADEVPVGKTVTFIELPNEDEEEYTTAESAEVDPFSGEISNDSPIAQALIGKRKNDEITIAAPGGDILIKIIKVEQV